MKLFLLLLLAIFSGNAQTISGTVFDETKLPLPGVSVYLDGTSVGTLTDENGKFSLSVAKRINTNLVFSFIGYEILSVENPFEKPKYEVHMQPKASMLKEVVIGNDGFSRKSKLKAFREEFLGKTKAGRSCKIFNEDDIDFLYDYKTNTLKAFADKPLKVQNPYLGYEIEIDLREFSVVFAKKTVNTEFTNQSSYAVSTVFHEMPDAKKKFVSRRSDAYRGSGTEFLKNLIDQKWSYEGFVLYDEGFPTNPNEHFTVSNRNGMFHVAIKKNYKKAALTLNEIPYHAKFGILYKKERQSGVQFLTDSFNMDDFGNTDVPMAIIFSGEISKQRAGDLLPMDYLP
ncbi:carboxypeptidase-like regulatory domain-containing protein [Flavobacterium sp.]|uniref:carboxypeptidase-like regulatory domain-containing protein n=1 Tax=Flavobacterium sp. TaxID=239 RepID=UPI0025C321F4|nr:carboxypeptidase-like regulatory domain-containing protein [Flavobacterium sp.]